MNIDNTKTMSELLKELDLADHRSFLLESEYQQELQPENPSNHQPSSRKNNINSSKIFASNFERDNSIIHIDTSFNNNNIDNPNPFQGS